MEQVGLLALSSVLNVMLSTPPLPPPQSYTLLSPEHGQMATNCSEMINSKCCKDQCIKTSVFAVSVPIAGVQTGLHQKVRIRTSPNLYLRMLFALRIFFIRFGLLLLDFNMRTQRLTVLFG